MAITKDKKKEIVEKLQTIFTESDSAVFVNFHGLSVEDSTAMRKELRAKGVGYYVAKKTLTKIALANSKVEGSVPELDGELAIVYPRPEAGLGEDAKLAPAREVYSFQKKFPKKLSIMGGVYEAALKDKVGMTEVAEIPPVDVLRGMFVNVINSPIQGMAIVLNAIAEKRS